MDNIKDILHERGKRYGSFTGHARISQDIQIVIARGIVNREDKSDRFSDTQLEALTMIAHKIGRIVNGDPDYADSWRDIAGYATLVADELEGKGEYGPKAL